MAKDKRIEMGKTALVYHALEAAVTSTMDTLHIKPSDVMDWDKQSIQQRLKQLSRLIGKYIK